MRRPFECEHPTPTMRRRRTTNGTMMLGNQCGTRGRLVGTWVARDRVRDPQSLPEWDPALEQNWESQERRYLSEYREQSVKQFGIEAFAKSPDANRPKKQFFDAYDEYLHSDAWRQKRGLVLARANFVCEGCGVGKATQVHHLDYRRVGREMLFDLVAVCDLCHEAVHGHDTASGERAA